MKAIFKTLQTFLLHKKNIYRENSISIRWNGVKLQLIKEIQISRHMTTYGQNLGVFKRENNECSLNGEKTKLHKIKIVVLLSLGCVVYEANFVTNYVITTSYWRNSWRNTRHRPNILNPKELQFWFYSS